MSVGEMAFDQMTCRRYKKKIEGDKVTITIACWDLLIACWEGPNDKIQIGRTEINAFSEIKKDISTFFHFLKKKMNQFGYRILSSIMRIQV
jgi:hypothetical protein